MALSTSFSNFFSFPSPPTKSPPQPSILSPFPSHQNRNNKFISLVLSRNETSSSVTSSSSSSSSSPEPPEDMSSSFTSSLSSSNSLFLAQPYNVQVIVEEDEPEERLLNRFRREVLRAGVIQECKRRRNFENTQDEKKRRVRDAAKRNRRNRFPRRPMGEGRSPRGPYNNYRQDDPKPKKEEDDDNWDLPEEDVLNF